MAPTIRNTASYYTYQGYSVDFFGDELLVTVTSSPDVISQWINDVLYYNRFSSHPLVVGVGVQWTPVWYNDSDSSQSSYYADPPAPADTLQLCVGKSCLIIQLSHCDQVPNVLRDFLVDRQNTFVGIWNNRDARKLEESRHQLEIGELLDIRKYVGRNLRGRSFEVIVEVCMGYQGVRLDREISMSNWSAYNLTHDQILQASIDVHVCFKLGVWVRLWDF